MVVKIAEMIIKKKGANKVDRRKTTSSVEIRTIEQIATVPYWGALDSHRGVDSSRSRFAKPHCLNPGETAGPRAPTRVHVVKPNLNRSTGCCATAQYTETDEAQRKGERRPPSGGDSARSKAPYRAEKTDRPDPRCLPGKGKTTESEMSTGFRSNQISPFSDWTHLFGFPVKWSFNLSTTCSGSQTAAHSRASHSALIAGISSPVLSL